MDEVKTGLLYWVYDEFRGNLFVRLLCGTWEPVVSMLREKFKWRSHENESTDAKHRGGSSRISEEIPVMGMARRG
jgi:hypothetical protein